MVCAVSVIFSGFTVTHFANAGRCRQLTNEAALCTSLAHPAFLPQKMMSS